MHRDQYLKLSIENKLYFKKDWMIRAFSVIEDSDINKLSEEEYYKYQIIRLQGIPYVIIDDPTKPEKITDIKKNELIFTFRESFKVTKDFYPNLKVNEIDSTYGNLLFNLIVIDNSFKNKFDYVTGQVSVEKLEDLISPRLQDTPEEGEERDSRFIYIDEYKTFVNSLLFLTNFTQLCVWTLTEKLIQAPPGVAELKKKLVEANKGNLDDPVVLEDIQSKLKQLDDEYLKDDPGGQFFANNSKSRDVRKKLYLMFGAEKGLIDSNKRIPIVNSLEEGWTPTDMPPLMDALRAGSYNRGAETQLGGELTKWLFRSTTGIEVTEKDCGTEMGLDLLVTNDNFKQIVNLYVIVPKGVILVDNLQMAKSLIGKSVKIRTPLFCHTPKMNFCEICVGKNLSNNKEGISLAIAEIGSMFMLMKMKAMHGKILSVADLDLNLNLS